MDCYDYLPYNCYRSVQMGSCKKVVFFLTILLIMGSLLLIKFFCSRLLDIGSCTFKSSCFSP